MAASPQGRRLTEQHRLEQQQNRAAFLAEFIAVWALLDTARLDETSPGWIRTVLRLVQEYRIRSAQISIGYFAAYREVEAPPTPGRVPPVIELPRIVVPGQTEPVRLGGSEQSRPDRATSGRATSDHGRVERSRGRVDFPDLPPQADRDRRRTRIVMPDLDFTREDRAVKVSLEVTGPIAQKDKIRRGKLVEVARDESFVHAAGASTRHVLTGGRKSLLSLIESDQQAIGYIRVTDGDPCAFCAMLASRGVVYPTTGAAGGNSNASQGRNRVRQRQFVGDGEFKVHDNCACTVEAVYSRDAPWPGRAREFQKLWGEVVGFAPNNRYSGQDAINAFRRAYEQMQRDQRRGNVA